MQKSADEVSIICPSEHSHQGGRDNRPSFNINTERLVAHCLSCGFSLKGEALVRWLIGGELDDYSLKSMSIKAKIKQIEHTVDQPISEARQILIPPGEPWAEEGYRGISLETYRKLGAIHCERGWYSNRICFPVYVNGKLEGVDARALSSEIQPKYLRPKGCSCKDLWLYPYDLVKESKPNYVVLVEGIYDSINILDKLGPIGLSVFGTENFSRTKLRLIMATGCTEVVMLFDKDLAGQKAQKQVGAMLSDWLEVSEACIDHIRVDPRATLAKGTVVYQDCGDLSKEELEYAIENRNKFK